MAHDTRIVLIDDLDGTNADSSHLLTLDDRTVRIDLSAANAARLAEFLAPYLEAGRPARGPRTRPATRSQSTIRAWARNRGIAVADGGRIPPDVLLAFVDAHAPSGRAAGGSAEPPEPCDRV